MKLHLTQMHGLHFALFALQLCSYLELYFNSSWTLEKVTFTLWYSLAYFVFTTPLPPQKKNPMHQISQLLSDL